MSFFNIFPKEFYDIDLNGSKTTITDIFRFVDVLETLTDDAVSYQTTNILDGERPDILSQRLYGSPDYYWTFFVLNDFLKDGLGQWPKSQKELTTYIDDHFENLAVLSFPHVFDNDSFPFDIDSSQSDGWDDNTYTLHGLPINDSTYTDDLYLSINKSVTYGTPLESGEEGPAEPDTYNDVLVKIVYYDPIRYQLWVDKTQQFNITYSGGEGSSNDWSAEDVSTVDTSLNSTIFFDLDPGDAGDPDGSDSDVAPDSWINANVRIITTNATNETAWRTIIGRPPIFGFPTTPATGLFGTLRNASPTDLINWTSSNEDYWETFYTQRMYDHWEVAKTAPYSYYDSADSDSAVTPLYALTTQGIAADGITINNRSNNYVTWEQHMKAENAEKEQIKVIRPEYIRAFVEQFAKLINVKS